MKLLTLILNNFKGIKSFNLTLNGESVSIFGANGTGKTSLADAVSWLLFNKDTANKTDFGIKTLDANGVVIPAISHEVEATFSIRGDNVTLKKEYVEIYTKKRGSITSEFTGHETNHFIDGVPKSKKEYDKFIGEIISEDVFKLLTSPSYFNEQLHWKDRRKTLLAICGDISDSDVIAGDKSLAGLTSILGNRSLDDHKKVIAARRAKINEELTKIPVRIDEAQRSLPNVDGLSEEFIAAVIGKQKEDKQSKEQEISRIQNGGEVAEQQKNLAEIDSKIVDIKTRFKLANSDKSFAKKQELQDSQLKKSSIDQRISTNNDAIVCNKAKIDGFAERREILLKNWHEVNSRELNICQNDTCPTCKQELPLEQVQVAKTKALEKFNLDKSNELAKIQTEGVKIKENVELLQKQIIELESAADKLIAEKDDICLAVSLVESEIKGETGVVAKIEDDIEYMEAANEKQAINDKIIAIKDKSQAVISDLKIDIQNIETSIKSNEADLLKFRQVTDGNKRIAELSEQEKALGAEFEKLEGELYLVDQFVRTKVSMLEEIINSKFKIARFKMFNVQVNGGLDECCDTLGANGVPYGSGLNQAARINVGLDIINTLSDYYGFVAPIFVDNRESVSELINTNAQVISLIVSPEDKILRVG